MAYRYRVSQGRMTVFNNVKLVTIKQNLNVYSLQSIIVQNVVLKNTKNV